MATALKQLSFAVRVGSQRLSCNRPPRRIFRLPQPRFINTTASLRSQNVPEDGESIELFPASGGDSSDATAGVLPAQFFEDDGDLDEELSRIDSDMSTELFEDMGDVSTEAAGEPRWPPGFFSMDEERDDPGEDPEFENDDITSTAHGELEQHRELREFARVMIWDMPLLFNHARPYEAPSTAQPLRFRYTTYMGETHPASRKVVLTFSPSTLPDLNDVQTSKMIKLLGVRYNPSTTTAKLSCELYPTAAQNKRYLCDLLNKLTTEAKDLKDTFEDVPFDFRHHKPKKQYLFPEEWKLTDERRKLLDARREEKSKSEEKRTLEGGLVQGTMLIEEILIPVARKEKEPVTQMATGMGQKGSQQKRRTIA